MEKNMKQRWQCAIIVVVLLLTIYNILPTIIYYSKPLRTPIGKAEADRIIETMVERTNQLPDEVRQWILSFSKNLKIQPQSVAIDQEDPTLIHVQFSRDAEAEKFRQWVEAAGRTSIFLVSKQPVIVQHEGKAITLALRVAAIPSLDEAKSSLFTFFSKRDPSSNQLTKEYLSYIGRRYTDVGYTLGHGFFLKNQMRALARIINASTPNALSEGGADIDRYVDAIHSYIMLASEYPSQGLKNDREDAESSYTLEQRAILSSLYSLREVIDERRDGKEPQKEKITLAQLQQQLLQALDDRSKKVDSDLQSQNMQKDATALSSLLPRLRLVREKIASLRHLDQFDAIKKWSKSALNNWFEEQSMRMLKTADASNNQEVALQLSIRHPLFSKLVLDFSAERMELVPYRDIISLFAQKDSKQGDLAQTQERLKNALLLEASLLSKATNEQIETLSECSFEIRLHDIDNPQSFIALSTAEVAQRMSKALLRQIEELWEPASADFHRDAYPCYTIDQFAKASREERKMCLLAFSPASTSMNVGSFLKPTSLYIILRGAKRVVDFAATEQSKSTAISDINHIAEVLRARGFSSYMGEELERAYGYSEFHSDIIFELERFYEPYILATKEHFSVYGQTNTALLECTNVEARIRTENAIDDKEQDELLRWKEMWQSAQVSLNQVDRILVPKPVKNVFWSNLRRGARKYFRGDSQRIIRWGLDLSGGKSVKIGLYDSALKPVTDEKDLKQAVSELYRRLNKMGVSERTIRIENNTISIDFPGIQGVSSEELIQGSAMYFHVVNEKFGPFNKELARDVDVFLQEVWNEAQLTNRTDAQSINAIAYRKLKVAHEGAALSSAAHTLSEHGLTLYNPSEDEAPTTSFDDTVSMIVQYKEQASMDWSKGSHPLLIVFKNYALEGANLENVAPSYDPMKGNVLVFNIRSRDSKEQSAIHPQDEFYAWTSHFCEDAIRGTPRETYSRGRGWRMAVVLNGSVISDPALSSALRDSAVITGNFSQREVQQLAKDLEAGSLSYTPRVLSEYNVSPELGKNDRIQGIIASVLGIAFVIAIMVSYYRFAGIVACFAVGLNLLIIWAVMQNIEAAITLPALAGIVLTVGMAVDANVLVFERIREELRQKAKLSYAIQAGYSRAFSAIVDSNLTTLIAAFILTQFDSGPIRGFAVTLIIGILSSMFTALFVTRYYFSRWTEKHPDRETLSMAEWLPSSLNIDFFRHQRSVVLASCAIILVGAFATISEWRSMFGMDFTGGYALVVDIEADKINGMTPKEAAAIALERAGVKPGEFQIRELGSPSLIRIQLSRALEEEGRPFHNIERSLSQREGLNATEVGALRLAANPRIDWIVASLEKEGILISEHEKELLPTQWTAMSGQFSDTMRNNALYALGLSLIAILVYIAIRFEWKYAISSVIALVHDVILTLSVLAILHMWGLNLQINLEVVGAIMTIIGYSLNDTIIIFDRVREDVALYRKKNFQEIVNMALNSTLSRTVMTSTTTLAVLLSLVLFGGASIFTFSFVMFVGVLLGTISSLFIASSLLVYFDRHEAVE